MTEAQQYNQPKAEIQQLAWSGNIASNQKFSKAIEN